MHSLYVIHTQYMQWISACIGLGYIQIHWFPYHVHIHLYPSQRMHILNNDTYRYIQIHLIWTVISDLYIACIFVCIWFIFACIVCICIYFLHQNLLVVTIYTIYTDTSPYAKNTYKYAHDILLIHTTYMQIHTHSPYGFFSAYPIFECFIVLVSVCMCISCAYCVCI